MKTKYKANKWKKFLRMGIKLRKPAKNCNKFINSTKIRQLTLINSKKSMQF